MIWTTHHFYVFFRQFERCAFHGKFMANRKLTVATSLHPTSVSLFDPKAVPSLLAASRDAFVFMGSEGDGLPEEITGDERCTNLRIPSMVRIESFDAGCHYFS